MSYALALLLTLALEVPLVAWFYPGERARLALACAFATTVTHLLLHFGLPRVIAAPGTVLVVGEALALLGEAAVYARVSRSRSVGQALVASTVANTVSYGAGLVLLRMVMVPA